MSNTALTYCCLPPHLLLPCFTVCSVCYDVIISPETVMYVVIVKAIKQWRTSRGVCVENKSGQNEQKY